MQSAEGIVHQVAALVKNLIQLLLAPAFAFGLRTHFLRHLFKCGYFESVMDCIPQNFVAALVQKVKQIGGLLGYRYMLVLGPSVQLGGQRVHIGGHIVIAGA